MMLRGLYGRTFHSGNARQEAPMTTPQATDDSPGAVLFPEYDTLHDLIAREVEGMSDDQLDWESDRWEWAAWSVRRQLSHMASLLYRWLLVRWGDTLFADGGHGVDDVTGVAASDFDRRLDENKYWALADILARLREGVELARRVLAERNVGFLRDHAIAHPRSAQWVLMYKAHPSGIEPQAETGEGTISLEATFRHMYFEEVTHLFNIHRLKRAQGLSTVVDVPRVGYWVIPGWDVSEP